MVILIGPSVEECFKSGFENWCRDVQIIGDCMTCGREVGRVWEMLRMSGYRDFLARSHYCTIVSVLSSIFAH